MEAFGFEVCVSFARGPFSGREYYSRPGCAFGGSAGVSLWSVYAVQDCSFSELGRALCSRGPDGGEVLLYHVDLR